MTIYTSPQGWRVFELPAARKSIDRKGGEVRMVRRFHAQFKGAWASTENGREEAEQAVIKKAGSTDFRNRTYLSTISVISHTLDLYEFELIYLSEGHSDWETDSKQYDPPELNFTTIGEQQHITHSRQTDFAYGISEGEGGPTAQPKIPLYGNAIGVHEDGKIDGVQIVVPKLEFTMTHRLRLNVVQPNYLEFLAKHSGQTNLNDFSCHAGDFQKDELLFLGASGKQLWRVMPGWPDNHKTKWVEWKVSFQFRFSPTEFIYLPIWYPTEVGGYHAPEAPAFPGGRIVRNAPLSSTTIRDRRIEKPGHHHAWVVWEDKLNLQNLNPAQRDHFRYSKFAKYCYVERIYPSFNFTNLRLGEHWDRESRPIAGQTT